jgi:multidrug efflux pump subunit AcrA (membrane-fusion protein)
VSQTGPLKAHLARPHRLTMQRVAYYFCRVHTRAVSQTGAGATPRTSAGLVAIPLSVPPGYDEEARLVYWHIKEGDKVQEGDPIFQFLPRRKSSEILKPRGPNEPLPVATIFNSPIAGTVAKLLVEAGRDVKPGTEVALIETDHASESTAPSDPGSTARQSRPAKRPSTPSGKVKVSFNLWPDELDQLRGLASKTRTTVTAALQRAIADEVFLDDQISKGAQLLLRYPTGEYREVIMRR